MPDASPRTPQARAHRKLRVGIIDLISKEIDHGPYARVMNPSFASIMPQVVSVWAEQLGHDVTYVPFVGYEDILREFPADLDVLFVAAFTQGAYLAYTLSNYYRSRGVVTVLGGPHARAYPEDARLYFDYVVQLANKDIVDTILHDPEAHPDEGVLLTASQQPSSLPGVRERWKFISKTLEKSRFIGFAPMIGSLGCPYTCSFCIDAAVQYQTLPFDQIREDLRFLAGLRRRPFVGWHDPNFGVRFNEYLETIESCVPPGALSFVAESSLSVLSEAHLQRLRKNNFVAMLPGIESWFDYGAKSKQGRQVGLDRVKEVAAHVNMVASYIPYVTSNFIFGLDVDEGAAPFELTKRFVDLVPAVYPKFTIITSHGRSTPLAAEYMEAGRVLDVPFRFLGGWDIVNIALKNYEYLEFYDLLIDLVDYAFSARKMWTRCMANDRYKARLMLLFRMVYGEKRGNQRRLAARTRLATDKQVIAFYRRDTYKPPTYLYHLVKQGLGPLAAYLPQRIIEYFEHGEAPPNTRIFKRPSFVRVTESAAPSSLAESPRQ